MSNNQKMGLLFFLPLAILLLTSCTRLYYNYNSVSYDMPEAAYEAHKKDIETALGNIKATENPSGGSAVVILPSKAYLKKNVVELRGSDPGPETKEKMIDYTATLFDMAFNAMGRFVEKRRIFDSVAITNSDNPEGADFSEGVALKLFKKEGKMHWFLLKKKANGQPIVKEIEGVPESLPTGIRTNLWLERVEKAAKGE